MSNLQPANYNNSPSSSIASSQYNVVKIDGKTLVIENNPYNALYAGQRLTVDKTTYAIVTKVDGNFANALMTDAKVPAFLTNGDWAPIDVPRNTLLVSPELAGELYVRCSNTLTDRPGYVGWSLTNDTGQLLAIGNDYEAHNICAIKGTGVWGVAVYTLEVRSFLYGSLQPINYAKKTWYISSVTSKLTIGSLNDGHTSLILS